ncbi:MAG TPA: IS701 family transposase [Campylobacterales bacterium]|nr:IS701 family transposase [Campylobacterales bacterium]
MKKRERSIEVIITILNGIVDKSFQKKLIAIIEAILAMSGRVTMLSIARWNNHYSYRTIERFFDMKIDWLQLKWGLIKDVLGDELILVADESTITKAGKATFGVGWNYSGLLGKAVNSIQIVTFAIVDVKKRRSFPIFTRQLQKIRSKQESKEKHDKPGRPEGSKNKNSQNSQLTGLFRVLYFYLAFILKHIKIPKLKYFVYDGALGNTEGVQVAKRNKLHLISKLKNNSALYFPYQGEQNKIGAKRIYEKTKIDFNNIGEEYLKETQIEDGIKKEIYQFNAYNKTIGRILLNIVVTVTTNKKGKKSRKINFSTDTEQSYQKILEYYSLRFQVEFSFRDAKQFFGLEDFMNIKKIRIHNFANLALFMNNVTYLYYEMSNFTQYSISDIKSLFMGKKYALEVLKLSDNAPIDIFNLDIINRVSDFARIHRNCA